MGVKDELRKVKNTRNKVTSVLFIFNLALGVGFYLQNADSAIWGHWFTFNISLLGFWFGAKSVQDIVKSIWYRPELDDAHPEIQEAYLRANQNDKKN